MIETSDKEVNQCNFRHIRLIEVAQQVNIRHIPLR